MIKFRYQEKNTAIHRLNPFAKLAWVVGISIVALIFNQPCYLCLLFLSTLPLVVAARVWREWISFLKLAIYLCLAIIVINALISYHGTHVLWQSPFRVPVIGTPIITLEALIFGVGMSLRLLTIISAFAILTLTVHPDDIMQAMLKMKIPYKSILVISLSTRFFPTLIDDAERISDTQRTRGLELDRGHLFQRIRKRTAVIIPLLSNSLDRTVQLAEAMEARAFGSGEKRVFFKVLKLNRLDTLILIFSLCPLLLGGWMRWNGWGNYQYYPTLGKLSLNGMEWSMLFLLLVMLDIITPLAVLKKRLEFD